LNAYCQKYFLSSQDPGIDFKVMKERFYSLPGYAHVNDSEIIVSIDVPTDYLLKNDLNFIIGRINELGVFSGANKRLTLSA
jgi:hypothetical protein